MTSPFWESTTTSLSSSPHSSNYANYTITIPVINSTSPSPEFIHVLECELGVTSL
jgi:hypothetical protein